MTGLGSPRGRASIEAIDEVLQTLDIIEPSIENLLSSNVEVSWEDIGRLVGGGIGVGMAILSSPLIATDGPLPIMDAAWWVAQATFTKRSVATGARVGLFLDENIGTTPGDIYDALNYHYVVTTNSLAM
ncbi:MAG: hypothetical protein [Circular genetic element sp.]|nr:MAG: hypothetical protein [Circular genetic element sp.]